MVDKQTRALRLLILEFGPGAIVEQMVATMDVLLSLPHLTPKAKAGFEAYRNCLQITVDTMRKISDELKGGTDG